MELRLMKEHIQMEQPAPPVRSRAAVEGEMALPGGLREETRVMYTHATAVIDHAEASQNRVKVAGKVTFHTLYTQGDPEKISAVEASADFTHMVDAPGVTPKAICVASVEGVKAQSQAQGGRLHLQAAVDLAVRATSAQPVEAVTGLRGGSEIQAAARESTIQRTVATGGSEVLLREEFDLPAALQVKETLFATAAATVGEITGGLGREGISGQVNLEAVHASALPGQPLVTTRHEMPFRQVFDLLGENGDALSGDVTVKDVAVMSAENADGTNTLRAEVLLSMTGRADRTEKITLLEDAYTTLGEDLKLTSAQVPCRVGCHQVQTAESGKALLMLPEGAPPCRTGLCAFASVDGIQAECSTGRTTITGKLHTTVMYLTDGQAAPVSAKVETPFRQVFAAEVGPEDDVHLDVQDAEVSTITSDRLEMRYVMRLQASGTHRETLKLVTDAQPVDAPVPPAGIILYYTQPGESRWDIAKRYRVPMERLQELNPELTGEPAQGQGVVVWRRATGDQRA